MMRTTAMAVVIMFSMQVSVPMLQAQALGPHQGATAAQAVAKGLRALRAKGWTPSNRPPVTFKVSDDAAGLRPIQSGGWTDGGVYAQWTNWDDGNPSTWEGIVSIWDAVGNVQTYGQQVDFSNPDDPTVVWQQTFYVQESPATRDRRVGQREPCPTCPQVGVAKPVIRKFPDFKNFYKCSSLGCGLAALLMFIPGGAAGFFAACTGAMVRCAFGRLWEWKDVPDGD